MVQDLHHANFAGVSKSISSGAGFAPTTSSGAKFAWVGRGAEFAGGF